MEMQLNMEKQRNIALTSQLESANQRAEASERRANDLQFSMEQLELQYSARFQQNLAMVWSIVQSDSDTIYIP